MKICSKCNIRLAALDDTDWFQKALIYLKKYRNN